MKQYVIRNNVNITLE